MFGKNFMWLFVVVGDGLVFANTYYTTTAAANPLPFAEIKTVSGNRWDNITHSFYIAEAQGLYFVGLTVGTTSRTPVNYTLVLSGQHFGGITRTSTAHDDNDQMGHDFLIHMFAADTMHVSSQYAVRTFTDVLDTSLTIFSLSYRMVESLVAFSVAREDSLSGLASPFPFTTNLYISLYYNPFSHRFTAPSDGIYFFSFSVGLDAGKTAEFILYKNSEAFAGIVRKSTTLTGTDTIGRSVMMNLEQGDIIYMVNEAGETARSSSMKETSFSGFKYEPRHGIAVSYSKNEALLNQEKHNNYIYQIKKCIYKCQTFSFNFSASTITLLAKPENLNFSNCKIFQNSAFILTLFILCEIHIYKHGCRQSNNKYHLIIWFLFDR